MDWIYKGNKIDKLPEGVVGFVYEIHYANGQSYIGKKLGVSETTLPALQTGIQRPNSSRIQKKVLLTKEERAELPASRSATTHKLGQFDVVSKPNRWQSYEGSSKLTDGLDIHSKVIMHLCKDKRSMTYLEVAEQFIRNVIFDKNYLNENIGGRYFDNALDGLYKDAPKEHPTLF